MVSRLGGADRSRSRGPLSVDGVGSNETFASS